MFLIILHHYSVHGPWPKDGALLTTIAVDFLSLGGKIGVCVFVIITGYFMSRSRFRFASILKLVLQTLFFSWMFLAIQFFADAGQLDFKKIKTALIPLTTGEYWFVTTYIVLMLLSPLVNLCLHSISDDAERKALLVGFVLFSVIPTLVLSNSYTSNVVWFCYLYLVGAYVRDRKESGEFEEPDIGTAGWRKAVLSPVHWAIRRPALAFVVCLVAAQGSMVLINCLKEWCLFTVISPKYLFSQNMLPVFLMSLAMFCFFAKLKPFHSKVVNFLAKSAFGVYLIHDNMFVRAFVWKPFEPLYGMGGMRLAVAGVVSAVAIYLVCAAIDTVRRELLEKPVMDRVEKRFSSQISAVDVFFNKLV